MNYYIEGNSYVIEDYDKMPEFSSFLPGLVGVKGIPMWVFYGNRGQGVNSFGVQNKNNAIMEFNPANTAYENSSLKGFRTFLKSNGEYYEPFLTMGAECVRKLRIRKNSFEIEEVNHDYGLRVKITYFVLPREAIGALVRRVEIQNIHKENKTIEGLDGIPKIIPYGITNSAYKEMSNLLKSWTEVKNLEHNVPFYTMRASSDDSAEVSDIEGGYFYLSIHNESVKPVIVDKNIIFGYDSSLIHPIQFMEYGSDLGSLKEQCYYNKVPCAFTPFSIELEANEVYEFYSMTGFTGSVEQINDQLPTFLQADYFDYKRKEADKIVEDMTKDIRTKTALPIFDQYLEQCYLDNFLRGGYPFVINQGKDKSVVHLFSRKHGDPERDYNFFSIAGEYYSQGNGNFRDVNQNRRNDIFFQKNIEEFNIKTFYSLIQIDGYNPLEVRPSTFTVKAGQEGIVNEICEKYILREGNRVLKVISKNFTPGQISNCIAKYHLPLGETEEFIIASLLYHCDQHIEAGFGEGYWSDHWDYNLDLIESFRKIYPDKEIALLFDDPEYRYYDSPARILPRSETYVLNSKGQVRQYGSLIHDEDKLKLPGFDGKGSNWLKNEDGTMVETTLMTKLISLALNKFTLLDPYGMGIEMEGGKPGWNDAMNGLPGLFGSGMSETFELKRMLNYILSKVTERNELSMPKEIKEYLYKVSSILVQKEYEGWNDFTYWDLVATERELYRKQVRLTLSGEKVICNTDGLEYIIGTFLQKVEEGIRKASGYGEDIMPTYFTYHVNAYEEMRGEDGKQQLSHYGLVKVKVKDMSVEPLPAFLEGPTKFISTLNDVQAARKIYENIKDSDLYDRKLGMYKTSISLDHISMENGRIRAFTAGWLERESIFLHMEYKYLYALQKAGLWQEFYDEINTTMIPFRNPKEYGRSILENSSFLASSVNPDKEVHGRGFVARLSGSTTEVISMWISMFIGNQVFSYNNNQLTLEFNPNLPDWFFDENGEVSFTFLSHTKIVYRNLKKKSTFGEDCVRVKEIIIPERGMSLQEKTITGELAHQIREGVISQLIIVLD